MQKRISRPEKKTNNQTTVDSGMVINPFQIPIYTRRETGTHRIKETLQHQLYERKQENIIWITVDREMKEVEQPPCCTYRGDAA